MPSKKGLPVVTLFMLLVFALAAVGVGYGMWSKTLFIRGTVNTGNVDAELSVERIIDIEEKDVGSCSATLGQTNQPRDTLIITIANGYPSYTCMVTFDVHNTGTIPVKVRQPVIVNPNPNKLTVALLSCYPDGAQIHSSERVLCDLSIHVEQPADQSAQFSFSATVLVHQYNEEPK